MLVLIVKVIIYLFQVIKWPNALEQNEIARENQLLHGLPDIIGALDGTHIRISSCPNEDNDSINRKKFPSMQLQVLDSYTYMKIDRNLTISIQQTHVVGLN